MMGFKKIQTSQIFSPTIGDSWCAIGGPSRVISTLYFWHPSLWWWNLNHCDGGKSERQFISLEDPVKVVSNSFLQYDERMKPMANFANQSL